MQAQKKHVDRYLHQILRRSTSIRSSSSSSWTQAIKSHNDTVNAMVHVSDEDLTSTALDSRLEGLPIAIKDNICTSTMPTTCSSNMLREFRSPFDATVVELLLRSGAIITGKTNCDEFGMGSLNTYSVHGPVINPFGLHRSSPEGAQMERRSAGGSSGGGTAAVSAKMCWAALGTDTGGSIRLPASYCGVVGLKPSYGLISRWGVISYSDSLDCVGVMANTVTDTEKVFDVLSVYDDKDPTAATPHTRQQASDQCVERMHVWSKDQDNLKGLRIGVPQECFPSELSEGVIKPVRDVLARLKSHGADLIPVSLPSIPYALSAYYVIASAEASSNLARYDGIQYGLRVEPPHGSDRTKTANVYAHTRSQGFGHEVQKRILLGTYALSADAFDNYFLQAQRIRKLIRTDFDRAFCVPNVLSLKPQPQSDAPGVDVLIHPSAIRTAPSLDDADTGLNAYVQDVLTVPASLAGLPALSVPAGQGEDDWPVGVSVVGQWGCDKMVLGVGRIIERLLFGGKET